MKDLATTLDVILFNCLFNQSEIVNGKVIVDESMIVKVEGIVQSFWFHKERLEIYRSTIAEILNLMPIQFHKNGGGGWSFLNLCNDKYGNQWGEQKNAQNLYALANGLGLAKFNMPKESWDIFPGGMPYITFDVDASEIN